MQIALLLAYPVLAHLSVSQHSSVLAVAALLALAGSFLWPGLRAGRRAAQVTAGVLIAGAMVLHWNGVADGALLLPPIAICAAMFWLFAASLRPGHEPLATQIARAERGALTPELETYTRSVTWLWSATLFILTLSSTGLAVAGTPAAWSLFTNLLNYLVIVGVFGGEYLYRRIRFRALPHRGLLDQLKRAAQLRPRVS